MNDNAISEEFTKLAKGAKKLKKILARRQGQRKKMDYVMLYREVRDLVFAACELEDPAEVERWQLLLRPRLRRLKKLQANWHRTKGNGVADLLLKRLDEHIAKLHRESEARKLDNALKRLTELIPTVPEQPVPEEAYALVRQLRREKPEEEKTDEWERYWTEFESMLEWQQTRYELYQATMAVRLHGIAGGEVVDTVLRPLVQHYPRCCSYAAALLGVAHGSQFAGRDPRVDDLRERLCRTVKQTFDEHRFRKSCMHSDEAWRRDADEIAERLNALGDALRGHNEGIWLAENLSGDFILLFRVMLHDGRQEAIDATNDFRVVWLNYESEDDPWQTGGRIDSLLAVSQCVQSARSHLRGKKLDEARRAAEKAVDMAVENRVTSLEQLLTVARIHLNASWPFGKRGLAEATSRLENRLRRGDPARHTTLKGEQLASIVAELVGTGSISP
jgi:hypothetical protein